MLPSWIVSGNSNGSKLVAPAPIGTTTSTRPCDSCSLAVKGAVYSNFKSKDDLFLELFHYRVDRQFAVVGEALDTGSHDQAEQFPRILQLLRSDPFPWDDSFVTLWLEFILYARRNPDAQKK